MRAPVIMILLFLIAGALVLTMWPHMLPQPFDPSPPGQFPLRAPRPQWPAIERVAPYRPGPAMGSNMVANA